MVKDFTWLIQWISAALRRWGYYSNGLHLQVGLLRKQYGRKHHRLADELLVLSRNSIAKASEKPASFTDCVTDTTYIIWTYTYISYTFLKAKARTSFNKATATTHSLEASATKYSEQWTVIQKPTNRCLPINLTNLHFRKFHEKWKFWQYCTEKLKIMCNKASIFTTKTNEMWN